MKSLTEEQILDLVDGDHLSMGPHGSIDKTDKSGDGGVPTKKDSDGKKDDNSFVADVLGNINDIFYNHVMFD
jgi:hypothetical protein